MTTIVNSTTNYIEQNAIIESALQAFVYIAPGVAATSNTFQLVVFTHSYGMLHVDGSLFAFGDTAIMRSLNNNGHHQLFVGQDGSIGSVGSAVLIEDAWASITNLGTIAAGISGIVWKAYTSFDNSGAARGSIINDGVISADVAILLGVSSDPGHILSIVNSGSLIGRTAALNSGELAVAASLRNTGEIFGDVRFGALNDRYDGRGGEIEGNIYGGAGNDTFLPGVTEETIDGGAGVDTLEFRGARAVTVALFNNLAGVGRAEGDDYLGFENILGSRANDQIYGNDAVNRLDGGLGADIIWGAGGADALIGRSGADTLTGGTGNDLFIFSGLGDGIDRITDFGNLAGNDDRVMIARAGFAGLAAGPLLAGAFVTRADNAAQQADDRFILRTTDKTLWYDSNGNVAGGLTQIAVFTAGVPVSAADFLLF